MIELAGDLRSELQQLKAAAQAKAFATNANAFEVTYIDGAEIKITVYRKRMKGGVEMWMSGWSYNGHRLGENHLVGVLERRMKGPE